MIQVKIKRVARNKMWASCLLLAALMAAGLLLTADPAHAATFTVNSTGDAGDNNPGNGTCATQPFQVGTEPECTLRAAIQEANVNGVSDTIVFDSFLSGTITLTLGELVIANDTPANDLLIEGPGANKITVSANGRAHPVFFTNGGTELTISGLTISDGHSSRGGGIYSDSGTTLTLINSTVSGNSASTNGQGGGIFNDTGSTLGSTLTLVNSTVSGNSASSGGGGITNNDSTVTLTNSTVSENTSPSGTAGGIRNHDSGSSARAALTLTNTIVARNTANTNPDILSREGTLTSQGHNLIGDTTGSSSSGWGASDRLNVNPLLGPLQDNGGLTLTHALLQGSPALNAISNATNGCGTEITTDQRGVSRPQEGKCEIGSFEPQDSIPPNTTITSGPSGTTKAASASFSFVASETDSTFQCSLDGTPFSACVSPKSYSGLTAGSHTFRVQATDVAGNVDLTPASRSFTVDAVKPAITPLSPKAGSTTFNRTVKVQAVVRDNLTNLAKGNIRLFVDGKRKTNFTYNPGNDRLVFTARNLSFKRHTVRVVATDGAGNVASRSWSFTVKKR